MVVRQADDTPAGAPPLTAPRPRRAGGRRRGGALKVYVPAGVLLVLVFFCFVWPEVYPVPPPVGGSILGANLPIGSPGHLLGTDTVGNDILSRILYGGRVSFEVGAATQVIGLVIGGLVGTVSACARGVVDIVVMRLLDALIAFPALILVLTVVDELGPSEAHVIFALSFFTVPAFARLARASTLRALDLPFVTAARLSGSPWWRVIARHLVPNVLPALLTYSFLGAGIAIILEGALSYLGYGIPPPGPSWGNMIADGQAVVISQPSLVLVPTAFLFVTVVALNALGDGLRARWASR